MPPVHSQSNERAERNAGAERRHHAFLSLTHAPLRSLRIAGSRRPLLPRCVRGGRSAPDLRDAEARGPGGVVRGAGRLRVLGGHPPRGHRRRQPELPALQLAPGDPAGGNVGGGARRPAHHDGARPARAHPAAPLRQPRLRAPVDRDLRAAGPGHRMRRARQGPGPGRVRLRRRDRQAAAVEDAVERARGLRGGRRLAGRQGRRDDREQRSGLHRSRGRSSRHRCVPADALPLPGRGGGLRVRGTPGGDPAPAAAGRRDRPPAGAARRREASRRPRIQEFLHPADRGRERHHALRDRLRHPRPRQPAAPVRAASRGRREAVEHGGGGAVAHELPDHALPPHRDGGLRDARAHHRGGGQGDPVVHLRQP